jgi:predicted secreted Zn-dependent protease
MREQKSVRTSARESVSSKDRQMHFDRQEQHAQHRRLAGNKRMKIERPTAPKLLL